MPFANSGCRQRLQGVLREPTSLQQTQGKLGSVQVSIDSRTTRECRTKRASRRLKRLTNSPAQVTEWFRAIRRGKTKNINDNHGYSNKITFR